MNSVNGSRTYSSLSTHTQTTTKRKKPLSSFTHSTLFVFFNSYLFEKKRDRDIDFSAANSFSRLPQQQAEPSRSWETGSQSCSPMAGTQVLKPAHGMHQQKSWTGDQSQHLEPGTPTRNDDFPSGI